MDSFIAAADNSTHLDRFKLELETAVTAIFVKRKLEISSVPGSWTR